MKKPKKNLLVLTVSLPDEFNDVCEACAEADVTTDQAVSFESALQKIKENSFDMILLNACEPRGNELIVAAKQQKPSVITIGFSYDDFFRARMIESGCSNAVHFDDAQHEIETWLEKLAK